MINWTFTPVGTPTGNVTVGNSNLTYIEALSAPQWNSNTTPTGTKYTVDFLPGSEARVGYEFFGDPRPDSVYGSVWMKMSTGQNGNINLIAYVSGSSPGNPTQTFRVRVRNTDKTFCLINAGAEISTGIVASTDTWYRLDTRYDRTADDIQLKIYDDSLSLLYDSGSVTSNATGLDITGMRWGDVSQVNTPVTISAGDMAVSSTGWPPASHVLNTGSAYYLGSSQINNIFLGTNPVYSSAIEITNITSAFDTTQSGNFIGSSASFTGTAGSVIIVNYCCAVTGGLPSAAQAYASITGFGGSATLNPIANGYYASRRRWHQYALTGHDGSTPGTVDFYETSGAVFNEASWIIDEATGVSSVTPWSGFAAETDSNTNGYESPTNLRPTVTDTPDPGDVTYSMIYLEVTGRDIIPEAGWTQLAELSNGTNIRNASTAWNANGDPQHGWTWTPSGPTGQTGGAASIMTLNKA